MKVVANGKVVIPPAELTTFKELVVWLDGQCLPEKHASMIIIHRLEECKLDPQDLATLESVIAHGKEFREKVIDPLGHLETLLKENMALGNQILSRLSSATEKDIICLIGELVSDLRIVHWSFSDETFGWSTGNTDLTKQTAALENAIAELISVKVEYSKLALDHILRDLVIPVLGPCLGTVKTTRMAFV